MKKFKGQLYLFIKPLKIIWFMLVSVFCFMEFTQYRTAPDAYTKARESILNITIFFLVALTNEDTHT